MTSNHPTSAPQVIGKLINLIPVGLKEAALDSPSFRATTLHFADQIDLIETWLETYSKSASKLTHELPAFETLLTSFMGHAVLPNNISEGTVDHDYSLLVLKRYGEASKDFWTSTLMTLKRLHVQVVDPIRYFINNDVRAFKDVRRGLDANQKQFDYLLSKFASQAKTKEPSSLREDAFQLHEARKAYLKSSMDFCTLAPQLKASLDKLLIRIFSDQWREMRIARDDTVATFSRVTQDMERIKGWTREMEDSEKIFRRELQAARKQLEDTAEGAARPSRELDDYSSSTVPFLGTPNLNASSLQSGKVESPEKQGWVSLRTYTGKPTRTVWVRRWAFVKNGIFGWLIQGGRSGGVEESERIGVLLCNVRPAFQEERRFCFEIKTKNNAMMLQAETQADLTAWVAVFETAKKKALDDPAATNALAPGRTNRQEPAFAISAPPVPEFAATLADSLSPGASEDTGFERSSSLPVPGGDSQQRDGAEAPSRRSTAMEREEGSTRDRIIQKLDLHRKSVANSQLSGPPSSPNAGGGIASLIAASHGSMPVGPGFQARGQEHESGQPKSNFVLALRDMPSSSLAPATLVSPPMTTSLSRTAVVVSGERNIIGNVNDSGSIPTGMMANLWGSSDWGYVNRLEPGEAKAPSEAKTSGSPSPKTRPSDSPPKLAIPTHLQQNLSESLSTTDLPSQTTNSQPLTGAPLQHRSTISLDGEAVKLQRAALSAVQEYPNYYPLQLRTQDAQFRLLFPGVKRDEKLVMVFRATWNPNNQQEFPGRVYVTMHGIYFYSNYIGLILTNYLGLRNVAEVTAAPGRDCDFLFLHLKESRDDDDVTRVTIKTFLESLKLLQRRLNFLISNYEADEPLALEAVIKNLIKMEHEVSDESPSMESWEDVSLNTPVDEGGAPTRNQPTKKPTDLRAPIRVDRTLDSYHAKDGLAKQITKFKLPSHPVEYTPTGNLHLAVEKFYNVSPKALFHVLFGDRSAVWQLLQHERRAQNIKQGPWLNVERGGHLRRDFQFEIESASWMDSSRRRQVQDYQIVEALNDHLCYVVTDKRTAWHLPYRRNFRLMSKIVITHVAKSKSKLAIFTKVEWVRPIIVLRGVIEKQAMNDLELDALDLVDLVTDQVRKLGANSRTKKAIQIFGHVGQQSQTMQFEAEGSTLVEIDPRRLPQQKTLLGLVLQTLGSLGQSAISSLMLWTFAIIRWVWKTCTANSVILIILATSIGLNVLHTSSETSSWWQERKASNFMARMGVHPNTVLSKAVYVQDLGNLHAPQTETTHDPASDVCYTAFYHFNNIGNVDDPLTEPRGSSESISRAPARRMQRTRQRLGSYRHDLLVAMRVVDRIEQELLSMEWERWVQNENRQCKEVGSLLQQAQNDTESDREEGRNGELKAWHDGYCGSCRKAQGKLVTT